MEKTQSKKGILKRTGRLGLTGILVATGALGGCTHSRIKGVDEIYNPLDDFKGRQVYTYNIGKNTYTAKQENPIYEQVMKQSPSYKEYQNINPKQFGSEEYNLIKEFDKLKLSNDDKKTISNLYPWINLDNLKKQDKVFLMKIINDIGETIQSVAILQSFM